MPSGFPHTRWQAPPTVPREVQYLNFFKHGNLSNLSKCVQFVLSEHAAASPSGFPAQWAIEFTLNLLARTAILNKPFFDKTAAVLSIMLAVHV